jgi:hypothetical protein
MGKKKSEKKCKKEQKNVKKRQKVSKNAKKCKKVRKSALFCALFFGIHRRSIRTICAGK